MRETILEGLRSDLAEVTTSPGFEDNVWEEMAVLNTWSSNAIEGISLTQEEVRTLLVKGISVGGHSARDVLAVIQHGNAFRDLRSRVDEPMSTAVAVELHDAVFRGVIPGAGRWRDADVHIPGSKHRPPHGEEVDSAMGEWEAEYGRQCRDGEPAIKLAAWMHYSFEAIHPFVRGNGRIGRLLLNLHLIKQGWPPIHVLPTDRKGYFAALEEGNMGDLAGLEALIRIATARSLLHIMDLLGRDEDRLRPIDVLEQRGTGFVDFLGHMADEGQLPAVRVGNTWYTTGRALELFNGEGPQA